jgi:hypothetical protein
LPGEGKSKRGEKRNGKKVIAEPRRDREIQRADSCGSWNSVEKRITFTLCSYVGRGSGGRSNPPCPREIKVCPHICFKLFV